MIKIKFAKFILIFTLALVSINACYPTDFECVDNNEIIVSAKIKVMSAHLETAQEKTKSNATENETHYCLCSLNCHTMFFSFTSLNTFKAFSLDFPKEFKYTAQNYPEISYSLEKPPKV